MAAAFSCAGSAKNRDTDIPVQEAIVHQETLVAEVITLQPETDETFVVIEEAEPEENSIALEDTDTELTEDLAIDDSDDSDDSVNSELAAMPEPEPEPESLHISERPLRISEEPQAAWLSEPDEPAPAIAAAPEPQPALPETPPSPVTRVAAPNPAPAAKPAAPASAPPAKKPAASGVTPSPAAKPASAPSVPVAMEETPALKDEPVPQSIPALPGSATTGIVLQSDNAVLPMVFSRVVRATVGQLVEVPFWGTGWVYLGEAAAQRGIVYDSRRLDPDGQSFIFKAERAGEYALKFYRQDFIRDFILNDYVQVLVGAPYDMEGTGWFGPSFDQGRAVAGPRWPNSLIEAQMLRGAQSELPAPAITAPVTNTAPAATTAPATTPAAANTPAASAPPVTTAPVQTQPAAQPPVQTVTPAQAPAAPAARPEPVPDKPAQTLQNLSYESFMHTAQEEYEAGRIESAISVLNQLFERYSQGSDEALWLLGQYYEANSPGRNILASLDCYRRLVQEYPQSSRHDDARRRISYLQRYYININ